jgi:hypothetical protein
VLGEEVGEEGWRLITWRETSWHFPFLLSYTSPLLQPLTSTIEFSEYENVRACATCIFVCMHVFASCISVCMHVSVKPKTSLSLEIANSRLSQKAYTYIHKKKKEESVNLHTHTRRCVCLLLQYLL